MYMDPKSFNEVSAFLEGHNAATYSVPLIDRAEEDAERKAEWLSQQEEKYLNSFSE